MLASKRIYKKADGTFCLESDPDAAVLAYAATDEVEPDDRKKVKDLVDPAPPVQEKKPEPPADVKKEPAPANKAAKPPANK